jgi:hypothetical protein
MTRLRPRRIRCHWNMADLVSDSTRLFVNLVLDARNRYSPPPLERERWRFAWSKREQRQGKHLPQIGGYVKA